jgi:hypothetical protein
MYLGAAVRGMAAMMIYSTCHCIYFSLGCYKFDQVLKDKAVFAEFFHFYVLTGKKMPHLQAFMLLAVVSGSFQQFQLGVNILSSTATGDLDIEGSINEALT